MDKQDKFLLIILLVIFLGYTWGIPKTDIYNAVVTLLVVGITAGILIKRRKE